MAFKKFIKFASVLAICFGALCLSVVPASTASAAQTPVTCPDGSLWKGHESEVDANGKLRITSVAQCNMPYNSDASKDPEDLTLTVQTIINVIIGVIVAFILGVVAAVYRDKWPDQVIRILSIACIATPSFWLAVLLILVFSFNLKIFPASGALPAFLTGGWWMRMILPALALSVPLAGQLTRVIRTSMAEECSHIFS